MVSIKNTLPIFGASLGYLLNDFLFLLQIKLHMNFRVDEITFLILPRTLEGNMIQYFLNPMQNFIVTEHSILFCLSLRDDIKCKIYAIQI